MMATVIVVGLALYVLCACLVGRRLRAVRSRYPVVGTARVEAKPAAAVPLPNTVPQRNAGPGLLIAAMKPCHTAAPAGAAV